jgi:hypothetical protein
MSIVTAATASQDHGPGTMARKYIQIWRAQNAARWHNIMVGRPVPDEWPDVYSDLAQTYGMSVQCGIPGIGVFSTSFTRRNQKSKREDEEQYRYACFRGLRGK